MPDLDATQAKALQTELAVRVRSLQIVHLGLAMGIGLFAVVVGALSQQPHPTPTQGAISLCTTLSVVLMALTPTCYAAAIILFGKLTRASAIQVRFRENGPGGAIAAYFGAAMARVALCEGPALFGLVVLVIATTSGVLAKHLEYLADTLPALMFMGAVGAFFPRPEAVYSLLAERIALD